ncbi:MAG: bile acid:sodium symporter [Thermodesulfobacteriota bacterium]
MLHSKDWLMLAVAFGSMAAGVFLPDLAAPFRPLPVYCMMALLFLGFISLDPRQAALDIRRELSYVMYLTFLKLVGLPAVVYLLFWYVLPRYALAALLLTGISSGMVTVFFSQLLGANTPQVLSLLVASSVLAPLTLPALVKLLAGQAMTVSYTSMAGLLALIIFTPLAAAELIKRFSLRLTRAIESRKYSLSLVIFACTNLGIFSEYSSFFRQEPRLVWSALLVAVFLGVFYFIAAALLVRRRPLEDHLAALLGFGMTNFVLALVFGARFFTPLEPTVAALYSIPAFGLLVPINVYRSLGLRKRSTAAPSESEI